MDRLRFLIQAAVFCAAAACGSSLPLARSGTPNEGEREYVQVPYPPPAAQVEVIPAAPDRRAVWVDGEWSWKGKRWVWEPGGFVIVPQKDAYFARWTIAVRPEDGTIRFSPGSWYAPDGTRLPKPRVLAAAGSGSPRGAPPSQP
jgi:hypothetical protein